MIPEKKHIRGAYNVPDGYFESLDARLQERIQQNRKQTNLRRLITVAGIAAALAGLLTVAGPKSTTGISESETLAEIMTDTDMQSMYSQELYLTEADLESIDWSTFEPESESSISEEDVWNYFEASGYNNVEEIYLHDEYDYEI